MEQLSVTTYAALRRRVEETLLAGQRKIDRARVETYWNAGRYIHAHLLCHKDRAEYGKEVILRLSQDLEVGDDLLYRTLRFFRAFPGISAARRKLGWTHYRILMAVPDERKRLELIDTIEKEGWNSRRLEIEVRNFLWDARVKALDGKPPSLLPVPVLGPFYTYQIRQPVSVHPEVPSRVLDVGFSVKKDTALFPKCNHPDGTIVTSMKDSHGCYSLAPYGVRGTANDALYTYKAFVEKVIDGDTLKVEFDIGFGDWRGETLRLKGIDCPEIDTPEGKRAKAFVEGQLKTREFIVVKSIRTQKEKWGRYLGDVFLPEKQATASPESRGASPLIYLNNLLLEKGHAVRVRY